MQLFARFLYINTRGNVRFHELRLNDQMEVALISPDADPVSSSGYHGIHTFSTGCQNFITEFHYAGAARKGPLKNVSFEFSEWCKVLWPQLIVYIGRINGVCQCVVVALEVRQPCVVTASSLLMLVGPGVPVCPQPRRLEECDDDYHIIH